MSDKELGTPAQNASNSSDGAAAAEVTDNRRLSRRRVLQAAGLTAGAVAAAATGLTIGQPEQAAEAAPKGRTGTMADLKHIVIVMQENRSFDHYFGTLDLPGVRGFGDKQALVWQNGQTNFYEPSSRAEGYLLPYHADTKKYNAQNTSSRMFYFKEQDIPWQHALAKAYTVCDHYYCSLNTSTDPNRIMLWTGTNDPQGTLGGGPRINNSQNGQFLFKWETYPEVLQRAGITWQMYLNNDISTRFLGDFEDNLLRDFAAYNPANATPENSKPGEGLLARANVLQTHTQPPAGVANDPSNIDYVLKDFIADCAAGTLPQVSWITSSSAWSEHPNSAPNYGAIYVDRVIKAVHDNPELWDSTLIILNYDEPNGANRIGQGGFFDHVLPAVPEDGTPGEGAPGLSPGFGGRVPLVMVSPWTRGGWVNSEVFDHTSTIKLIEQWTTFMGKPAICQHISAWRRSVSGDMLSAIDFSRFDNSFPKLPAPAGLAAVVVADTKLPAVPQPPVGQQVMPVQPNHGALKVRPLSFQANAVLLEDRTAGSVAASMSLQGGPDGKAVSMLVFADKYLPQELYGAPYTVSNKGARHYTWDATQTDGKYAFSIYGPDRFVRSFAGQIVPAGEHDTYIPRVEVDLITGRGASSKVKFTLHSDGTRPVRFKLTGNDFLGDKLDILVAGGTSKVVNWPTKEGYYDVILIADPGTGWTQRYAGRLAQA
ncbi:alkaline phosphatase family protein [Actinopolymorpha pittospori]|uniref:phospholipase C n=1 Tax=Actinopolymorpha pittospori TaxID=648752 RepID=A0A927R9K0_9ACTN|nr:alkaline phosphatase family protein [Actinopolymorpha pittospori]MBE1604065.1 phospholipase C [Actinopolymorpha pittospori]